MTISKFIAQYKNQIPKKARRIGNVFQGDDGNFYSQSYSYPLLVKLSNVWVLNIQGSSHVTVSHIRWAREHADFEVDLDFATNVYINDIHDLFLSAIHGELEYIEETLKRIEHRDDRSRKDLVFRAHHLEQAKLHANLNPTPHQ